MGSVDGISPRVLSTLQQLGLTEYGARCYVALVGLGAAEASTIADAAEVPRTKVYGVLKDLVDSGWVAAEGGRPARYRAAPPEERVQRAEKEMADATASAVRELQARKELAAQMIPMSMYMLRGEPVLREKTLELIARARKELLVVLGFTFAGETRALAEALDRAKRREVAVRLLIPAHRVLGPMEGLDALGALLHDARQSPFPFRAVVTDFRQALVTLPQVGVSPESVTGMWNPTEAFVQMIAPMLRHAWDSAPPYLKG